MRERGIGTVVVIAIVVVIIAVAIGGYYCFLRGKGPVGPVTLRELYQDFDNASFEFRSHDSGDIIQIQDTVENVILVTRDEINKIGENVANLFETSYGISFPVTLIMMKSVENMHDLWVFPVIVLEGDKRSEYEIGQTGTVSVHIEKALGINAEYPQEAYLGTTIWAWVTHPLQPLRYG